MRDVRDVRDVRDEGENCVWGSVASEKEEKGEMEDMGVPVLSNSDLKRDKS